jgi:hypothetical protein
MEAMQMVQVSEVQKLQGLLEIALTRKGWRFREADATVRGRLPEWPAQVEAILDPGNGSRPPALGIIVDFGAMPLGGERFRDVLNADRDMFFRAFGPFVLRQVREDCTWAPDVPRDSFVIGFGPLSGVSTHTSLAIFDRVPKEQGDALVQRFIAEVSRLAEVGNHMAMVLQRLYQRTVLDYRPHKVSRLPDTAGTTTAPEPMYPWRR